MSPLTWIGGASVLDWSIGQVCWTMLRTEQGGPVRAGSAGAVVRADDGRLTRRGRLDAALRQPAPELREGRKAHQRVLRAGAGDVHEGDSVGQPVGGVAEV